MFDLSLQKEVAEIEALLEPSVRMVTESDNGRMSSSRGFRSGRKALDELKMQELLAQIAELEPLVEKERQFNIQQMNEIVQLQRLNQ